MSDICPYVKPKNTLFNDTKKNKVIKNILEKLSEIQEIRKYQNDLEFLLYVCMLIEHLINNKNKKDKINKEEIVLEIYKKLFGNVDNETIKNNIKFLIDNNKINKIGLYNKCLGISTNWIKRKLK